MTVTPISTFKRDGQHETPQAISVNSINGRSAKSAPVPCPPRRSRRLQGLEVVSDKSTNSSFHDQTAATTRFTSNSLIKENHVHKVEKQTSVESKTQAHVYLDDKTPELIHQVQPDSVSSVDGCESSDQVQPCIHKSRPLVSSDFQRDKNIRIKFPKSQDVKRWKELNLI
jgi:hypothetical protein